MVREPVPSWISSQVTFCPSVGFVGAARVRLPPRVTRKWLPNEALVVIVAASVNATAPPAEPPIAEAVHVVPLLVHAIIFDPLPLPHVPSELSPTKKVCPLDEAADGSLVIVSSELEMFCPKIPLLELCADAIHANSKTPSSTLKLFINDPHGNRIQTRSIKTLKFLHRACVRIGGILC